MAYKILILDDVSIIRNHLKNLIADNGYKVDTARTKEEAIASIIANPPNLALLDIQLSDDEKRGGVEVAQFIIENEYSFPFVFLSGHAENFQDALEAKPAHYLSKLDSEATILRTIELELKKHYSDSASYANIDFGATHIFVKTREGKVKINHDNIFYIGAVNVHVNVVTDLYDKKPVTKGQFLVSSTQLGFLIRIYQNLFPIEVVLISSSKQVVRI